MGRGGEVGRRRQFALPGLGFNVSIPAATRGAGPGRDGFDDRLGRGGRFRFGNRGRFVGLFRCGRWRRRRFAGVNLCNQPPFGGLETGGGQDRLDRLGRPFGADLGGQQALEPLGGGGHAGAARGG